MSDKIDRLIEKASSFGLKACLLNAEDITVENRIALKCAYGCPGYGHRLSCPPHLLSIEEFKKILKEYKKALLLVEEHDTSSVEDLSGAWSEIRKASFHKMLELEYEAFREGFTYAHLLRPGSCNECEKCGDKCAKPKIRRFAPEAVGVNLQAVMEKAGMELAFCRPGKIACVGLLLLD